MAVQSKYSTIINWIKEKITEGEFKPGDKLISENELSVMFGVSRQTARHATSELVEQKYLYRVQGSGTYISKISTRRRKDRLYSIGVVCNFSESYIGPLTLKGIESMLFSKGYSTQVFFTDNKISKEKEVLKSIIEKNNIDALIFEPTKSALPSPNIYLFEEIQRRGIPLLSYNASYPDLDVPCVRIDDSGITYKAVKELVKRGHKKIAGIFKSDDSQGLLRYKGYIKALSECSIETDQNRVSWYDTPILHDFDSSEEFFFRRIGDSTAVVCYNDQIAHAIENLAIKRGIKIPDDLSIIGVDDSALAYKAVVPITSFLHPKESLGEKTAENIINMLDNPEYDGNYIYDSEIIVRESIKNI